MKLKRILALILIVFTGCLVFSGCGENTYMLLIYNENETLGTVQYSPQYKANSTVSLTAIPAESCEFVSFVDRSTGAVVSTDANYSFKITKDTQLKVNFRRIGYNVTLKINGTDVVLSGANYGFVFEDLKNATTLNAQVKTLLTGYEFNGWVDGDGQFFNVNEPYNFKNNITLTASTEKKSYRIRLKENGIAAGELVNSFQIGDTINELNDSTAAEVGYEFDAWFSGTSKWINGQIITAAHLQSETKEGSEYIITLNASFNKIKYTLQYSNESTVVKNQIIEIGDKFVFPHLVQEWRTLTFKINGSFMGENLEASQIPLDGSKTILAQACWLENEYKLTFASGDFTLNDSSAILINDNAGEYTVSVLPEATKYGNKFLGFYTEGNLSKSIIGSVLTSADVAFVTEYILDEINERAQYTLVLTPKFTPKTFTIMLDTTTNSTGVDSLPASITVTFGSEIKWNDGELFVLESATRWDWLIGGKIYNKNSKIFDLDIGADESTGTMVLLVTDIQKLSFVKDGEEIFEATISNTDGVKNFANFDEYFEPSKTGYTFSHWEVGGVESNGTISYDSSKQPGDVIIVTAIFNANPHTVTYKANGGEGADVVADTYYDVENLTAQQNTFTKAHYEFTGWSLTQDGAIKYQPEDIIEKISGDVVLFAVWEKIEYTIVFKNEDVTISEIKTKIGEAVIIPGDQFKEFHNFTGWFAGEFKVENALAVTELLSLANAQKTIIAAAQFEEITYKLVYVAEGATQATEQEITLGSVVTYEKMVRVLYKFNGLIDRNNQVWQSGFTINEEFLRLANADIIELRPSFSLINYTIYFEDSLNGQINYAGNKISVADYNAEKALYNALGKTEAEFKIEGWGIKQLPTATIKEVTSFENLGGFYFELEDGYYVLKFNAERISEFDDTVINVGFAPVVSFKVNAIIADLAFVGGEYVISQDSTINYQTLTFTEEKTAAQYYGAQYTSANWYLLYVCSEGETTFTLVDLNTYNVKAGDILIIGKTGSIEEH